MKGIWDESVKYFEFMRFTSQKYAKAFIENGSIRFGTPNEWVAYAKKPGMRGDKKEGTLLSIPENQSYSVAEINRLYGGDGAVIQNHENGKLVFRNKRHMDLPGFCFYLLKNKIEDEAVEMEQHVSGKMFTDFTKEQSTEDISKLAEEDKPAVIMIYRHDVFLERLERVLFNLGVKKDEIYFSQIKYYEIDNGSISGYRPLMELFCKDEPYSYQEEGRIIVNTKDIKVLKRLRKPISLGNMSDVANLVNWYEPKGIIAEIKRNND